MLVGLGQLIILSCSLHAAQALNNCIILYTVSIHREDDNISYMDCRCSGMIYMYTCIFAVLWPCTVRDK